MKRGPVNSREEAQELKNFVEDRFFEVGNTGLKIRQTVLTLVFLAILALPIIMLVNSLDGEKIWKYLYWTYRDGFQLVEYLDDSILYIFVIVLVSSLAFLFRNNHLEQKVYPKKKTYDEEKLKKRKEILSNLYTERFGEKEFRETTKYYKVEGSQNLPDHLVKEMFKNGKVEIK